MVRRLRAAAAALDRPVAAHGGGAADYRHGPVCWRMVVRPDFPGAHRRASMASHPTVDATAAAAAFAAGSMDARHFVGLPAVRPDLLDAELGRSARQRGRQRTTDGGIRSRHAPSNGRCHDWRRTVAAAFPKTA